MKPLAIILSAAFCILGTACFSGYPGSDLEVFDYSSGKTISRIPAPGFYREIISKNAVSGGRMPNVKAAFFTMAKEGEYPNARLILRRRDHNGNEVRRFHLPHFDAAWFEGGVYALSSDGREIAYWKGRKILRVRDLASGSDRVVFSLPKADDTYLEQMMWPENGRIIFAFTQGSNISAINIHVLGLDGTSRNRTFPDIKSSYPGLSISPDGKWIWTVRDLKTGDGQIVVINTETLRIEHVVPKVRTPQFVGNGTWSDDSKSVVFKLWSKMAATGKPADFYQYRLADGSLKHITTGIGSDVCIAIANGQIQILKNHNSVHVFSERDGSQIGVLPTPRAGWLFRMPGTTRWVF